MSTEHFFSVKYKSNQMQKAKINGVVVLKWQKYFPMQGQVFPSATDQPVNCTLIAGLHLQFEKPSIVSAPGSLFSNTIIGVDLKF